MSFEIYKFQIWNENPLSSHLSNHLLLSSPFIVNRRLKDPEGKVICPFLRAYDCETCHSGGGDRAHTRKYVDESSLSLTFLRTL